MYKIFKADSIEKLEKMINEFERETRNGITKDGNVSLAAIVVRTIGEKREFIQPMWYDLVSVEERYCKL